MRQRGGTKERMRIERNAQVTGASKSDEPANTNLPPALGKQDRTGVRNDQASPSTEHLLADQFLTDPDAARQLAAQLAPEQQDRREKIAALQSAVANGTYEISAEQTAEAMLAEHQVRDGTAA